VCTAHDIALDFEAGGWSTQNNEAEYGSTSMKSAIMNTMQNSFSSDDYVAVVDFDHGVTGYPVNASGEMHYMFEDDYGTIWGTWDQWHNNSEAYTDYSHGVYDMDIYPYGGSKIAFAFINTCCSADTSLVGQGDVYEDGNMVGMPYTWTHRMVGVDMSSDGYYFPDISNQVYIGFLTGSASLRQNIPYSDGVPYYNWVLDFFDEALYSDISVNEALDYASTETWGSGITFQNSYLRSGFTCSWPMWDGEKYADNNQSSCRMAVYGNGRIHLQQFQPVEYVSTPNVNGDTSGDVYDTLNFTASSTDCLGYQIHYVFDWGDGSNNTQTGNYDSGDTATASHSWASEGPYTVTVWAQSSQGVWGDYSNTLAVWISDPQVTYYNLTVNAYDYSTYEELYPCVYVDDYYVGTAPLSIQVSEGYHTIAVDDNTCGSNGYVAFLYASDQYYNSYNNGDNILFSSDLTYTAYYFNQR
jgi:hypothetical protein